MVRLRGDGASGYFDELNAEDANDITITAVNNGYRIDLNDSELFTMSPGGGVTALPGSIRDLALIAYPDDDPINSSSGALYDYAELRGVKSGSDTAAAASTWTPRMPKNIKLVGRER